jgi:cytochrome P450
MRTIGYLLGIPEADQETIRKKTDTIITLEDGKSPPMMDQETFSLQGSYEMLADYIEWRAEHPSDDLMTELLSAEAQEADGTRRPLTRAEVITYTSMVAGAGNETTTRLIGFIGQLLADHPDQRRELAADHSLIPRAIEEVLRYEAPSPVQARHITRDIEYYSVTCSIPTRTGHPPLRGMSSAHSRVRAATSSGLTVSVSPRSKWALWWVNLA